MADSTVHIGVIGASTDPSADSLEVVAQAPGVDCGSESASPSYLVTQRTFGAVLVIGSDEPGVRDSECLTSPELTFSVSRGTSSSKTDLPIAIRILEEAPVESGLDDLPSAPESPSLVPAPEGGSVEDLEGATSFDEAPRLESGTTYAGSVGEGEERLYRVRLGWGQSLSARVEVPAKDEATTKAIEYVNPGVDLSVVDPTRDTFSDVLEGDEPSEVYADEPATLLQGTPPVAYLNRCEDLPATLPGDYWVSIAVQPSGVDRAPVEVPVELTVVVQGEEAGAPSYPGVVLAPDSSAGPEGYDPSTPYLVAQGRFSADPSDSPTVTDEGDGESSSGRLVGGSALAVVSLLSLVAGGALLRRRSSWSSGPERRA